MVRCRESRPGLGDPEEVCSPTTPSAARERAGRNQQGRLGPRTALCFSRVVLQRKTTRPGPSRFAVARGGRADAQADMPLAEASGAICVQRFDDSRTVQVTLRIAFRCVLHRCESQDIRC